MIQHSAAQRLALGLCLEEGAACCFSCSAPTPALVHLWCLQVLPHSTALETCPPCDKWEGLDHTQPDLVWPWAQHSRLPSWAGPRAEAVEAVSMQGWQLAGGWGSPHSFYFCCLCHMDATTTDAVIRLVPPSYFCINLWVCVAEPLPVPRVLQGSGGLVGAPYRHLQHHRAVLRCALSSLEMLGFFLGDEVYEGNILSIKKFCLLWRPPKCRSFIPLYWYICIHGLFWITFYYSILKIEFGANILSVLGMLLTVLTPIVPLYCFYLPPYSAKVSQ